jgi:hypothetical protein
LVFAFIVAEVDSLACRAWQGGHSIRDFAFSLRLGWTRGGSAGHAPAHFRRLPDIPPRRCSRKGAIASRFSRGTVIRGSMSASRCRRSNLEFFDRLGVRKPVASIGMVKRCAEFTSRTIPCGGSIDG